MAEKAKKEEVEQTEESIFDEAEVHEELPEETDVAPDEEEEDEQEFKVTVSNESPAARKERLGVKENADGRILTIKEVFHTRPKIYAADGTKNPPKKAEEGDSQFYTGKLGIKFEEDNLVEYYPNFKYFVNEGKVSTQAKIYRVDKGEDNSMVTKLFFLAVKEIGKPADEISDQDFYDFLVGKKVKIETSTGTYKKRKWFRNDIVSFEK